MNRQILFLLSLFSFFVSQLSAAIVTWNSSGTTFVSGDILIYEGRNYVALGSATNSTLPPDQDTANFLDIESSMAESAPSGSAPEWTAEQISEVQAHAEVAAPNSNQDDEGNNQAGAAVGPPSLVNFNGRLLNSDGEPVTGEVFVFLRVFPTLEAEVGESIYSEQIGEIEVIDGHYAFQFGEQGVPSLAQALRDNPEAWIQLSIDGDPLPRQRFASVPYALSSGSAHIGPGAIRRHMLSSDILADLDRSGPITRDMLAQDVRGDLNRTITRDRLSPDVLADLNRSVPPIGPITRDMLSPEVRGDLNRTISRDRLSPDILADLNRSAPPLGPITRDMLAPEVRGDLNRTITREMLPADVRDDLNRSRPIAHGSITRDMLAPGILDDGNESDDGSFASGGYNDLIHSDDIAHGAIKPGKLDALILKYLRPESKRPRITTGEVAVGQQVFLENQGQGKYLIYQWYKNGEPISAATRERYVIQSFDAGSHEGNYSVALSNDFGTVMSPPVELFVGANNESQHGGDEHGGDFENPWDQNGTGSGNDYGPLTIDEWNQEMLGKGFEIVGDDGDRVLFEFSSASEGRIVELTGEYAGEVSYFSYVYERDNDEIAYLLMTCEEGMDDDFPGITIQESVDYRLEFYQSGLMRWTEENGQAVNVDTDVIVWADDSPGSGDFHVVEYPAQFLADRGITGGGDGGTGGGGGEPGVGYAPTVEEWNAQVVNRGYEIGLMTFVPGPDEFSPGQDEVGSFLTVFTTPSDATEYELTDDPYMPEEEKVREISYSYTRLSESVGQLSIERSYVQTYYDEVSGSETSRNVQATERIGLYYSGEHEGRHAPLYIREVDADTGEELFMESMGPHTYSSVPDSDTFRLVADVESFLADRGITGGGDGGTGGGGGEPGVGYAPTVEEWNAQVVNRGYEIGLMTFVPGPDEFSPGQDEVGSFLTVFTTPSQATEYELTDDPYLPEEEKIREISYSYTRLSESVGQLSIERSYVQTYYDEVSGSETSRNVRATERIGLYYSGEHEGRHAPLYIREVDADTGEELFMESMGPHTYSSIPESDTFRLVADVESFLADRGITGGGDGGTGGGSGDSNSTGEGGGNLDDSNGTGDSGGTLPSGWAPTTEQFNTQYVGTDSVMDMIIELQMMNVIFVSTTEARIYYQTNAVSLETGMQLEVEVVTYEYNRINEQTGRLTFNYEPSESVNVPGQITSMRETLILNYESPEDFMNGRIFEIQEMETDQSGNTIFSNEISNPSGDQVGHILLSDQSSLAGSNNTEPIRVSGGQSSSPYYEFSILGGTPLDIDSFYLIKGFTYNFEHMDVSTSHPFFIGESYRDKTSLFVERNAYGDGSQVVIPIDFQGSLIYYCDFHSGMQKAFNIK